MSPFWRLEFWAGWNFQFVRPSLIIFFPHLKSRTGAYALFSWGIPKHSDTRYTVGPLWPSNNRDLYLKTQQSKDTHKHTHTPSALFETAIPDIRRPQTIALDLSAIGIGALSFKKHYLDTDQSDLKNK
jgi:hypothetical protein